MSLGVCVCCLQALTRKNNSYSLALAQLAELIVQPVKSRLSGCVRTCELAML